ncbi:hypothetical protein LWI29_010753 [Acer saccharum]|uniref:Secreted protein n=1 Tax=Acer saccharum TaxID=4024 RepID=A0AA39VTB2_ACESA|nr:hypothetical protein LWI29_010753 [Acer saccharum]
MLVIYLRHVAVFYICLLKLLNGWPTCLKNVKNLDPRHATLVENAYYLCKPPESPSSTTSGSCYSQILISLPLSMC